MAYDYCVIMAGGEGTRLWPASNSLKPKQFLTIPGNSADQSNGVACKTFFSTAVERALSVTNEKSEILIIAGRQHQQNIETECAKFSETERKRIVFVPEPCAKNTAAAIAMASVYCKLYSVSNNPKLLVLASDHIIEPLEVFVGQAITIIDYIDSSLAVFGISPNTPETGYGYIEATHNFDGNDSNEKNEPQKVISFHEKPNKETAAKYLEAGTFFWNCGMFAFSPNFILEEFRKLMPAVLSPFEKLTLPSKDAYKTKNGLKILIDWHGLQEAYNDTVSISFDYAIAEKCGSVVMVKAEFSWCDVGSWDVYAKLSQRYDVKQNKKVFCADAKNNFVMSDIHVALCGCDDLIVVIQNVGADNVPIALIAKKGETQKIRDIVEDIKAKGLQELL